MARDASDGAGAEAGPEKSATSEIFCATLQGLSVAAPLSRRRLTSTAVTKIKHVKKRLAQWQRSYERKINAVGAQRRRSDIDTGDAIEC
jgi:hypothetical protein